MKRSSLKRKTALKRGDKQLKRSPLKRSDKPMKRTALQRQQPKWATAEERRRAKEYKDSIYRRDKGKSVLPPHAKKAKLYMDAHHCVPKRILRADGKDHLVWDTRNGILLTDEEHANHEARARGRVITFEQLPDHVIKFAKRHGYMHVLKRFHPTQEEARSGNKDNRRSQDKRSQ